MNKKYFLFLGLLLLLFGCNKKADVQQKPEETKKVVNKFETDGVLDLEKVMNYIKEDMNVKKLKADQKDALLMDKSSDHLLFRINGKYYYLDLKDNKFEAYEISQPKEVKVKLVEIRSDGYVVEHGGHYDFIKGKLDGNAKVGDYIVIIDPHSEENHEHNHGSSKLSNEKKVAKKENTSVEDDGYVFDPKDIVKETENGYIVKHGDHYHYIYKKDVAKKENNNDNKPSTNSDTNTNENKPQNNDLKAEIDAKTEFLAEYYGVNKKDIKYEDGYLIFPHGDHFHTIALKDVVIPKESDDKEADFEKELETLAKQMGVSVNSIKIEDGFMIVSHGDHDHRYKIKSSGWKSYLENRIPPIENVLVAGSSGLDRKKVEAEINRIASLAENKFKDDQKKVRRIKRALNELKEGLDWGLNTTDGYFETLRQFADKYIEKQDGNKPHDEALTLEALKKQFEEYKKQFKNDNPKYYEGIVKLNDIESDLSFNNENLKNIKAKLDSFKENYLKDVSNVDKNQNLSEYQKAYKALYDKLVDLDEDKHLNLKVKLLGKMHDIENGSDISKIKEIEKELEETLNKENKDDKEKQLQTLKNRTQYLQLNKEDKRLSEQTKQKIKDVLLDVEKVINEKQSDKYDASIEKVNEVRIFMSNDFREYEENQTRYSSIATRMISEARNIADKLDNKEKYFEEIKDLENTLKNSSDDVYPIYQKIVNYVESLKQVANKKQFEKDYKVLLEKINSLENEEDKKELINKLESIKESNSIEELKNIEKLYEEKLKDPSVDENTLNSKIEEILNFINSNRRNIKDVKEKVAWLNEVDDLETHYHNKTKDKQAILKRLQELKKEIEPNIEEDGSEAPDYSDWG